MDHVSTATERAARAFSALHWRGLERPCCRGAAEDFSRHGITLGASDPAAWQGLALETGRPTGRGKLAPNQAFVEELVAQDPDITLFELRDALAMAEGVRVHHSSIAAAQAVGVQL